MKTKNKYKPAKTRTAAARRALAATFITQQF